MTLRPKCKMASSVRACLTHNAFWPSAICSSSSWRQLARCVSSSTFLPKKDTMLPQGTFRNKVAFITGGGTGLGLAVATKLSELGASVAICSRNLETLKESASAIKEGTGNEIVPIQCDVRNAESVTSAVQQSTEHLGLPDIVINNAAGNFICPTERLSVNAFRTIVDIVLNGSAYVTLEIGKQLIAAKKGCSFLSVTTTYTQCGSGYVMPSAAAKAGLEVMTRSLASEWGKYGMRFNCIAPGPIPTKGAFDRLDPTGEFRTAMKKRIPCGRLGEVEEFANLATYVVSDYASWMTGEVITLDGGEFPYMAGEFNMLTEVPEEKWDALQAVGKAVKGS